MQQNPPIILGVDLGSWTFKISAYDGQKFDMLLNEANFRETPSLVAYSGLERLIGQAAISKIKSNYGNTIRAPLRLIGLERHYSLIEEELKYTSCKYQLDDELHFYFNEQKQDPLKLTPEHLLVTILSRVKQIVEAHHYKTFAAYISLPSYTSHYERKIIHKCAEIANLGTNIYLVDDWQSIASEYSYFRLKEIKAITEMRNVIFVDIGYSKVSIFLVQFSHYEGRLIDSQHLRFTGSKNMDHLLAEFYDSHFKKQRNSDASIFTHPKVVTKLMDYVEKQRKVLSANLDHHLCIQYLLDEDDLNFNMKREQFEDIVIPVVSEIASALDALKSRVLHHKLHSVELLGGASRIPYLQSIISNIYQVEPKKTLNQTEAIARGTCIYGAQDQHFINVDFDCVNLALADVCICWNPLKGDKVLGEDESLYAKSRKSVVIKKGKKLPAEDVANFGNEGLVELYVYYDQNISTKSIGYVRFMTPNKLSLKMDKNKILGLKLMLNDFELLKMNEKKEPKWEQIRLHEEAMLQNDQRLNLIYELKNQFESSLYKYKNQYSHYEPRMTHQEKETLSLDFKEKEEWIEEENVRKLGSPEDLALYQDKLKEIEQIKDIYQLIEGRK